MSDTVIRVENLSKKYTIRHQGGQGDGLRHVIQDAVTAPFRRLRRAVHGSSFLVPGSNKEQSTKNNEHATAQSMEEFYALRDVSFEVKRGSIWAFLPPRKVSHVA